MLDVTTKDSPGWWLDRLGRRLAEQAPDMQTLENYFTGDNVVPTMATKAIRVAYQRLMKMSRTNLAELVVEAVRERINVNGFRTNGQGDELGDKAAWAIWQGNSLDADFSLITRAALAMRCAYAIIGDIDEDTGVPLITPEDPRQVIAEFDPVRRRRALAALKTWREGDDEIAYLYLPGEVHRFERRAAVGAAATSWEPAGDIELLDVPIVPVVRFAGRPDMTGGALGEYESHLGILDRINYQVLSRLEIATLQAFKQRAVKGVPVKDSAGDEINYDEIFSSDPGAMWVLPQTAEMWESGAVDLGPVRLAIKDDVQQLAGVTRTPLFYLSPDAANGSAEGASLAREGLIFKTKDRLTQFGESVEQMMSIAFLMAGDTERAQRSGMQVIWSPPERFTLNERYAAATQALAAGMPWRSVMGKVLQLSPQEIDEMEAERASDALLAPPQLDLMRVPVAAAR